LAEPRHHPHDAVRFEDPYRAVAPEGGRHMAEEMRFHERIELVVLRTCQLDPPSTRQRGPRRGDEARATTPPRVVNGPSLLTGIAVCASCDSGMTRTGTTNKQGRSYSYYSCAGCQQKGKSVCKGRHIPAATLDDIVPTNLKERVLAPDRLAELLKSLIERQAAKSESADHRLLALQKELIDTEDHLKRLHCSIEDGVVELDDILRDRITALKSQRERAKSRVRSRACQMRHFRRYRRPEIDAFARLMSGKLDAGDTNTRKSYIRSIVDAVEVDDHAIRIIGGTSFKPPLPANRPRTEMFVVLYANGAPWPMKMGCPCRKPNPAGT
jgi:hypothetical protein